jgi:hypothetical protein
MFMSIYNHQVTYDGEKVISASLGPCCLVYRAQDVDERSLMVPVQISQDCSKSGLLYIWGSIADLVDHQSGLFH